MTQPKARAEIGIFEGPETVEIVKIRTNVKTGKMEVKANGLWTAWHPIHGVGIPLENDLFDVMNNEEINSALFGYWNDLK